jgi:UDP-N-acetylmuramate dehydrogenase
MDDVAERRRSKQPQTQPSAGSVFKRPPGHFAGKLIEESGLKGYSVGGAQVSEIHAGFIVNRGGASCSDVLKLIKIIQKSVHQRTGVMLETELRVVGEMDERWNL